MCIYYNEKAQLKENQQLFAAKYLTYLPDKEQLLLEIERQKEIFAMQEGEQKV